MVTIVFRGVTLSAHAVRNGARNPLSVNVAMVARQREDFAACDAGKARRMARHVARNAKRAFLHSC